MPNHIDNRLTVHGAPGAVNAFVALARGRHPRSGDKEGGNRAEEESPEVPFNFHSLVPLPDEYGRNVYGDLSPRSGYNLEIETWGIKWGAYHDQEEPSREPGFAHYDFRTAWNGPYKVFMPKVAARFPELLFFLSWGGEGPTRGRSFSFGGQTVGGEEPYRKEDYPAWVDDEGNELPGGYELYKAAQQARIGTHYLWVGLFLAHRAGHPFKTSGCALVLADWIQERGHEGLAGLIRRTDPALDAGPLCYQDEE